MKLHTITFVLVVIGALNWGLEVLGYGVGQYLSSSVETALYAVIGLSAVYEVLNHKKNCKNCM